MVIYVQGHVYPSGDQISRRVDTANQRKSVFVLCRAFWLNHLDLHAQKVYI